MLSDAGYETPFIPNIFTGQIVTLLNPAVDLLNPAINQPSTGVQGGRDPGKKGGGR